MYVLGSVTGRHFNSRNSDLDFLVSFKTGLSPQRMGANMLAMMDELEAIFAMKVDSLRDRPFANSYFANAVHESKILVYAAA